MVSKESVELEALFEVLDGLSAPYLFQKVKVAINVHAGPDESVPVHALDLDVRVVLLELEVNGFEEVNVRTLYRVHVLTRHLELVEVEVLREHLHLKSIIIKLLRSNNISCA